MPLLDLRVEYNHIIFVAQEREYRVICDQHAEEREAIREQVLAELRAKHGPSFGGSLGGRWAVGLETQERFEAHMARQYGVSPPSPDE